jgi:uncharacterized protein (TIGR02145 family)
MKNTLAIIFLLSLASRAFSQDVEKFIDSRDDKEYKTVTIGDQVWFAENLAYKVDEGCWAYNGSKKNAKKYGYLYNFQTAKEACPVGWHVPSAEEWKKLELFIGINEVQQRDWGNRKNKPAISFRLRAKEGWPKTLNGTDEFGFNMLPGGESGANCCFESMGEHVYFWTSTLSESDNTNAVEWVFYDDGSIAAYQHSSIYRGRYVRCLKD